MQLIHWFLWSIYKSVPMINLLMDNLLFTSWTVQLYPYKLRSAICFERTLWKSAQCWGRLLFLIRINIYIYICSLKYYLIYCKRFQPHLAECFNAQADTWYTRFLYSGDGRTKKWPNHTTTWLNYLIEPNIIYQ